MCKIRIYIEFWLINTSINGMLCLVNANIDVMSGTLNVRANGIFGGIVMTSHNPKINCLHPNFKWERLYQHLQTPIVDQFQYILVVAQEMLSTV